MSKERYLLIDPQDLAEIVSLIKQRDQLRWTRMAQWEKERDQELANNSKLFYGWEMSGTWASADQRQGLSFAEFLGQDKGKNYYLMLPKNHPAIANLERKEEGEFYLIKGLENIPIEPAPSRSTGENNPNNFHRWVELTDKITITPYNGEIDIKSLIQYLQKHSIKEISFKNGELVITHNNNEIVSTEKINDKQELALFSDIMKKSNQQKLTKGDLEKMLNANSISTEKPKGDNTPYWVVGGIGGILIIGIIIGVVVRKKRKNK